MKRIYIALDFDGTLVTHEFPEIGTDIGAWGWLNKIQDTFPEVRYILNTMRGGEHLGQAVDVCLKHGIKLFGINTNPTQSDWTISNKPYAHVYVDDAALGCPLITDAVHPTKDVRPFVNWMKVGPMLFKQVEMMIYPERFIDLRKGE